VCDRFVAFDAITSAAKKLSRNTECLETRGASRSKSMSVNGQNFPDRIASLALALFLVSVSTLPMAGQDVPTFHNDAARSGIQSEESTLTPSNVNASSFGKLRSFKVVGDVYAQAFVHIAVQNGRWQASRCAVCGHGS
jgi:hypothetical protein